MLVGPARQDSACADIHLDTLNDDQATRQHEEGLFHGHDMRAEGSKRSSA